LRSFHPRRDRAGELPDGLLQLRIIFGRHRPHGVGYVSVHDRFARRPPLPDSESTVEVDEMVTASLDAVPAVVGPKRADRRFTVVDRGVDGVGSVLRRSRERSCFVEPIVCELECIGSSLSFASSRPLDPAATLQPPVSGPYFPLSVIDRLPRLVDRWLELTNRSLDRDQLLLRHSYAGVDILGLLPLDIDFLARCSESIGYF
jgi:hypothetical protein